MILHLQNAFGLRSFEYKLQTPRTHCLSNNDAVVALKNHTTRKFLEPINTNLSYVSFVSLKLYWMLMPDKFHLPQLINLSKMSVKVK